MIHKLIEFSMRNRGLVIAIYLGLAAWGYGPCCARRSTRFLIFLRPGNRLHRLDGTVAAGSRRSSYLSAGNNLQGLPGVRVVRASSAFGFSMINIIFEDNVDLYWARTRVLERLNLVTAQLPQGVIPTLGPDATGVGQISGTRWRAIR